MSCCSTPQTLVMEHVLWVVCTMKVVLAAKPCDRGRAGDAQLAAKCEMDT